MRKRTFLLLAVIMLLSIGLSGSISAQENPEVVYQNNFENVNISASNTADSATGFVWVNRWQDATTEKHNGSNMLKAPLFDSADYSILGGLGIASRSNLALCTPGESYEVSLYMEMYGLDYMFVEYVGGDEKWGSVIIYPDGRLTNNGAGDNLCEASYVDNVLKFKFTMGVPFNEYGNIVNGYIKFTGYNCSGAYVYVDDISITKSDSAYSEDFSDNTVGVLNTLDTAYFGKFYSSATTEIIESAADKYLKVSKSPTSLEGVDMFYINRLLVLNRGRDYKVSLDLGLENVKKLYIYNVGTWNNPTERIELTTATAETVIQGNAMKNAVYQNGKLSFDFSASTEYKEYCQFQFVAEPENSGEPIVISIDDILFKQVPIVTEIEVTSNRSSFDYGKDLDPADFKVSALYSDGNLEILDASDCVIEGYDKNLEGSQVLTFSYGKTSAKIIIDVVRHAEALRLDLSSVKTEYNNGEDIDLSGLLVYAVYENGETKELENDPVCKGYSICLGEFDKFTPGVYTITITYGYMTESFTVRVLPADGVDFNVQYTPM